MINFKESFALYLDKRMIKILLLGIMSGFPWVLIGSALSLWLKEEGLSRSTIGFAGLIFGVYAINFLWAPLIDKLKIPFLTDKVGHRKSVIIVMQIIILISLVLWSVLDPNENLLVIIAIGLAIALSSATQDITIDALRIEQIGKDERSSMAAGAAMAVVGWWTGYKVGGIIALYSAEILQNNGIENYWQITFIILTTVIILCNIGLNFIPESNEERFKQQEEDDNKIADKIGNNSFSKLAAWFIGTVLNPLLSFFKKNGVSIGLGILAFIFLFKIGEAFLGRMSIVFYKEMGFSKGNIALYSKGIGWITTICFTLIGGLFAIRAGAIRALFIAGIIMAATNLLFTLLYWTGKSELLFAIAVLFDDVAAAFATVAFVTFISLLVDRTYTATQYALLASIGTMGRTLLASSSGAMVDWLDGNWGLFFIITALMVIPSLVCLYFIKDKIKFSNKGISSSSFRDSKS